MARVRYDVGLTKDRRGAVFQIAEEGTVIGHIILDATDLSGLIELLARARSELANPVSPQLDPGARISTIEHFPGWRVPDTHERPEDGVLLLLRHGGYGWIGYMLEPEGAKAIGAALTTGPQRRKGK